MAAVDIHREHRGRGGIDAQLAAERFDEGAAVEDLRHGYTPRYRCVTAASAARSAGAP